MHIKNRLVLQILLKQNKELRLQLLEANNTIKRLRNELSKATKQGEQRGNWVELEND